MLHREAVPTSGVVGWVGICAIEKEVVCAINIRISSTRPIAASEAHVPQGASIQGDIPATYTQRLEWYPIYTPTLNRSIFVTCRGFTPF